MSLGRLAAALDRLGWGALVLAAVVSAASVIFSMIALAPMGRTFDDWLTYVHSADRLLAGSTIYAPMQLSGPYALPGATLIGYAYPPSSVPLFFPFLTYPAGLVAWLTLNVGLLITGLVAILKRELGRVRPLHVAFLLFGLALVRPFWEGVAIGNASVGLAGVFAWSWALGRERASVGILAGVGATIKLVPAVIVFWSTPASFPRAVLTAVAVGLALAVVTLPIVGIQSWIDYVKALSFSQPACGENSFWFPPSVACSLQPIVGVGAAKLGGILLAAIAGMLAMGTRSSVVSFALLTFAWLAPVTDLHAHYLLVVYVLVVVVAASWLGRRRRKAAATATT